jgi:hypothetical protein
MIISLPLATTFYLWQSISAAEICALGEMVSRSDGKATPVLDSIKSLEPNNPWNLAVPRAR